MISPSEAYHRTAGSFPLGDPQIRGQINSMQRNVCVGPRNKKRIDKQTWIRWLVCFNSLSLAHSLAFEAQIKCAHVQHFFFPPSFTFFYCLTHTDTQCWENSSLLFSPAQNAFHTPASLFWIKYFSAIGPNHCVWKNCHTLGLYKDFVFYSSHSPSLLYIGEVSDTALDMCKHVYLIKCIYLFNLGETATSLNKLEGKRKIVPLHESLWSLNAQIQPVFVLNLWFTKHWNPSSCIQIDISLQWGSYSIYSNMQAK